MKPPLTPVHRALLTVLSSAPLPWKGHAWQLRPKHPDLAGVSNGAIGHALHHLSRNRLINASHHQIYCHGAHVTLWVVASTKERK